MKYNTGRVLSDEVIACHYNCTALNSTKVEHRSSVKCFEELQLHCFEQHISWTLQCGEIFWRITVHLFHNSALYYNVVHYSWLLQSVTLIWRAHQKNTALQCRWRTYNSVHVYIWLIEGRRPPNLSYTRRAPLIISKDGLLTGTSCGRRCTPQCASCTFVLCILCILHPSCWTKV